MAYNGGKSLLLHQFQVNTIDGK